MLYYDQWNMGQILSKFTPHTVCVHSTTWNINVDVHVRNHWYSVPLSCYMYYLERRYYVSCDEPPHFAFVTPYQGGSTVLMFLCAVCCQIFTLPVLPWWIVERTNWRKSLKLNEPSLWGSVCLLAVYWDLQYLNNHCTLSNIFVFPVSTWPKTQMTGDRRLSVDLLASALTRRFWKTKWISGIQN